MNTKSLVAFAFAFLVAGCGPTVAGTKLSKNLVCPMSKKSTCVMNSGNEVPYAVKKFPRQIGIAENGSINWYKFLGRELTSDVNPIAPFCGNVTMSNPLVQYANRSGANVVETGEIQHHFTFEQTIKERFGSTFGVDLDAALSAAGILDAAKVADVKAALRDERSQISNETLLAKGIFRQVTLDPNVVASLRATDTPPELVQCAEALKLGRTSIIVGLTGVELDTLITAGDLATKIISGFDSSLGGILTEGEIAALKASYEAEVTQKFSTVTKPYFEVLSVSGYNRL